MSTTREHTQVPNLNILEPVLESGANQKGARGFFLQSNSVLVFKLVSSKLEKRFKDTQIVHLVLPKKPLRICSIHTGLVQIPLGILRLLSCPPQLITILILVILLLTGKYPLFKTIILLDKTVKGEHMKNALDMVKLPPAPKTNTANQGTLAGELLFDKSKHCCSYTGYLYVENTLPAPVFHGFILQSDRSVFFIVRTQTGSCLRFTSQLSFGS